MFTGTITRQLLQPARGGGGDRPALSLESDQTWTYAQLAERADRYSNGLLARGVTRGDRVGMLLSNSLEYWALYLAITRIPRRCRMRSRSRCSRTVTPASPTSRTRSSTTPA